MDDDAERGLVFMMGISLGLLLMWLIFTTRGRRAALEAFDAAGDLAGDLAENAGDLLEDAAEATQAVIKPRKRFSF